MNTIFNINYALGRSILGLGTLLTFLFNDIEELSPIFTYKLKVESEIDYLNIFTYFSYQNIIYVKIICCIILMLVVLGFMPRIFGFLHFIISYSFFNTMLAVEGGDQITLCITALLFPITLLDTRINHFHFEKTFFYREKKTLLINFILSFLVIVKIQVSFLYFNALVEKLKVVEWFNGSATYYWFNHNLFGAPKWLKLIFEPIFSNGHFVFLVTWSVLLIEFLLFIAIFLSPQKRKFVFFIGCFFHFLIFIVHGLPTFCLAMWGALFLYLQPFSNTSLEIIKIKFKNFNEF